MTISKLHSMMFLIGTLFLGWSAAKAQVPGPGFIDEANFWIDANGDLNAVFPDPNSDGVPLGRHVYLVWIRTGCNQPGEPFTIAPGAGETWPVRWFLSGDEVPADEYNLLVSRAPSDDPATPSVPVWISGPREQETEPAAGNTTAFDRWLPHVPRLSGGFAATVKVVNGDPGEAATLALHGYDDKGALLAVERLSVAADGVAYFGIYGDGPGTVFADYEDMVSHVGIFEPAGVTDVFLRYTASATGFGAWVRELRIDRDQAVGGSFEMEGRGSDRSRDGVAVLNLYNGNPAEVWVVQRNRSTGAAMAESFLGELQPGEKRLSVVSDLFDFVPGTKYSFETRNPAATIQVMGLSFFGGEFFSSALVQRN